MKRPMDFQKALDKWKEECGRSLGNPEMVAKGGLSAPGVAARLAFVDALHAAGTKLEQEADAEKPGHTEVDYALFSFFSIVGAYLASGHDEFCPGCYMATLKSMGGLLGAAFTHFVGGDPEAAESFHAQLTLETGPADDYGTEEEDRPATNRLN